MTHKLVSTAKSLGWNVHKNPNGNHTIEIPIKNKELLLKEQEPNKWLLVSNQIPQAILKTKEASKLIKEIKKRKMWLC